MGYRINPANGVGWASAVLAALLMVAPRGWLRAQDQPIDASKPTNFYPLLENNLEYNSRDTGGDLAGYRAQLIYPPSDKWLFLVEAPILYNTMSEKVGLGDLRTRVFWLPYKNYDNFFGAFGPSIDVFAPTGSFEDGLGTSAWSVTVGVTGAFMFADWIQAFPIASYQYTSEPTTDLIPQALKNDQHGINLQAITPVIFSDDFFVQITPIWSVSNIDDSKTSRYIQELLAQYAITATLQLSAFWRGVFEDDDHTFRLGLVVFFQ